MILQALVEHYEDLAAQGKLARPGWSDANISYALYINNAGELEQVADIRQIPENGKGKPKPQKMMLPSPPTGRTSLAVKPAFLWDNSKYLLGIDSKGKLEQSTKSFQGSRSIHHSLLWTARRPRLCWRFSTAGIRQKPGNILCWRTSWRIF